MPSPPANQQSAKKVTFGSIKKAGGQRCLLYGPGGIGKTTLACLAPGPVAYSDAEESLGVLKSQLEEMGIDLPATIPATNFRELREVLGSSGWDSIKTIALEVTKIEQWAVAHTLATVKTEKDKYVQSIEGYGYGKGFQFVYDTFMPLLGDLDRHSRAGRNIILLAHECATVPEPSRRGLDTVRTAPPKPCEWKGVYPSRR